MDDLIGLIIGLIILALVLSVLFGYVLPLLFYSAAIVLVGWLAFLILRLVLHARLDDQIAISELPKCIEFCATGEKLLFGVRNGYRPEESRSQTVPAAVAGGIVALAEFSYLTRHDLLALSIGAGMSPDLTNFFALGLSAAGLASAMWLTDSKCPYRAHAIARIAERVRLLNAEAANTGDFDHELQRNVSLRTQLRAPVESMREALLADMQTNLPAILQNRISTISLINNHTLRLREENRLLSVSAGLLSQAMHTYDRACLAANRTNNVAILRYLHHVGGGLGSLGTLVKQKRWNELNTMITEADAELHQVIANAEGINQDGEARPQARADDPYVVLGVRRDLPVDELRFVYRDLVNLYHPDKARVTDHRKFQQIQAAWEAIRKERGIR